MKTTQPPLTSDEELAGYRSGAERMREMIERHEADLIAERQRTPTDLAKLEQIRFNSTTCTDTTRAFRTRLRHIFGSDEVPRSPLTG
jgi:IS5 family transposase